MSSKMLNTFHLRLLTFEPSIFLCATLNVIFCAKIFTTLVSLFLRYPLFSSRNSISILSSWNSVISNSIAMKATLTALLCDGKEFNIVRFSGAKDLLDFD